MELNHKEVYKEVCKDITNTSTSMYVVVVGRKIGDKYNYNVELDTPRLQDALLKYVALRARSEKAVWDSGKISVYLMDTLYKKCLASSQWVITLGNREHINHLHEELQRLYNQAVEFTKDCDRWVEVCRAAPERAITVYHRTVEGEIVKAATADGEELREQVVEAKVYFIHRDSAICKDGGDDSDVWQPLSRGAEGIEYVMSDLNTFYTTAGSWGIATDITDNLVGLCVRYDDTLEGLEKPYIICQKKDSATNWEWPVKETK